MIQIAIGEEVDPLPGTPILVHFGFQFGNRPIIKTMIYVDQDVDNPGWVNVAYPNSKRLERTATVRSSQLMSIPHGFGETLNGQHSVLVRTSAT